MDYALPVGRPRPAWVPYLACAVSIAIIFLVDLALPLGVACGVPYIASVLLSMATRKARFTIAVAVLCAALTVAGMFLSPPGGEAWKVLTNRGLALLAIAATTVLSLLYRRRDDALAGQRVAELLVAQQRLVQEERIRVLRATVRTVHDLVNNFLNNLQLFLLEAEESRAIAPQSLDTIRRQIQLTAARLRELGETEDVSFVTMAGGARGVAARCGAAA